MMLPKHTMERIAKARFYLSGLSTLLINLEKDKDSGIEDYLVKEMYDHVSLASHRLYALLNDCDEDTLYKINRMFEDEIRRNCV